MVLKENTPPTKTIPAGPEIRTHNLPVTSPTSYPLGHDCPLNAKDAFKDALSPSGRGAAAVYTHRKQCAQILKMWGNRKYQFTFSNIHFAIYCNNPVNV